MKILVVGEGAGEIGDPKRKVEGGWMVPLLERLLKELLPDQVFEFEERGKAEFARNLERRYWPHPEGHGRIALEVARSVAKEEYDAIIYMVDCDSDEAKIHAKHVQDIKTGFERFDVDILGIACVPMVMSESWLLADRDALERLGLPKSHPRLPKKPEELPPRKHADSSKKSKSKKQTAKDLFNETCWAMGREPNRITRAEIGGEMGKRFKSINGTRKEWLDYGFLANECPVSFKGFIEELKILSKLP